MKTDQEAVTRRLRAAAYSAAQDGLTDGEINDVVAAAVAEARAGQDKVAAAKQTAADIIANYRNRPAA